MVAVGKTAGDSEYLSASYEVPLTASPTDRDSPTCSRSSPNGRNRLVFWIAIG
jgi:hypothetical protein